MSEIWLYKPIYHNRGMLFTSFVRLCEPMILTTFANRKEELFSHIK